MGQKRSTGAAAPRPPDQRELRAISFAGDDASLVLALQSGQPAAIAAFHDRYAQHMLRLLVRMLGNDPDLEDVHHEVFVRALGSIASLRDPASLTQWMVSVAVLSARTCLQRRYRRRWLSLWSPSDLAELGAAQHSHDYDAAAELRSVYAVLDRLPADERIVFTLRVVQEMALGDVAEACGVSLATAKRRLERAEARFSALIRRHPLLLERMGRGGRWNRE